MSIDTSGYLSMKREAQSVFSRGVVHLNKWIMKNIVVAKDYEKNGEKKTQRTTIGRLIEKWDKQYIKIDVIPLEWDWFANVFEQKEKDSTEKWLPF